MSASCANRHPILSSLMGETAGVRIPGNTSRLQPLDLRIFDKRLTIPPLTFRRGEGRGEGSAFNFRFVVKARTFPVLFREAVCVCGMLLRALAVLLLPLTASAVQLSFSNTNTIIIPGSSTPPTLAALYPSSITVTGLTNFVAAKVAVTLQSFTHSFPSDVSILLVDPSGQRSLLMAEVGGQNRLSVTNLSLTLDDDASLSLPIFTNLVSGTFKPTNGWLDPYFGDTSGYLPWDFPSPAPAGSSNSVAALSMFKGTNPNGAWRLFVLGETLPDSGAISNGWSLNITAIPVLLGISRSDTSVIVSWTNLAASYMLQSSPGLFPPTLWTNVPGAVLVSGQFMLTNPATGPSRYYRLAK